jgi:hypothetical protein
MCNAEKATTSRGKVEEFISVLSWGEKLPVQCQNSGFKFPPKFKLKTKTNWPQCMFILILVNKGQLTILPTGRTFLVIFGHDHIFIMTIYNIYIYFYQINKNNWYQNNNLRNSAKAWETKNSALLGKP